MNKVIYILFLLLLSCNQHVMSGVSNQITAKKIVGNTKYQAICYGGYRTQTRDNEPTISEIKDDLRLLSAMNIRIMRTYNVHYKEAANLTKAISELKKENSNFEMYLMLGAWIDCKNAWTEYAPNHDQESDRNAIEIKEAVRLAQEYPEIIKIISVGNEAMVKWATNYYVQPAVILKWVNYLQGLKKKGALHKDLWITSSDNFASWGGGAAEYHVEDLNKLINAVDYISVHTYPMHDTHYHPVFWGTNQNEETLTDKEKIDASMLRARDYATSQYKSVVSYMKSIGVNKPVHIGETGWASEDNKLYGENGSRAADEYKSGQYYKLMRDWTNKEGISCFYFEAFDEIWKDNSNPKGSENHFGLINLNSEVKFALWDLMDKGIFKGLTRNGKPITKTYKGDEKALWLDVNKPFELVKN
jgi:exo-beta-1,3-glucanase (GH17 family)